MIHNGGFFGEWLSEYKYLLIFDDSKLPAVQHLLLYCTRFLVGRFSGEVVVSLVHLESIQLV